MLISAVGPGLFCSQAQLPVQGTLPVPAEPGRGLHPGAPAESRAVLGGSCRTGKRAPVNPTQFIIRPEQFSLEIRLYQVSFSQLHPRIVFERLLVPAAHLLLQPPQQLPLESAQPCWSSGMRCRPNEGLLGAGTQSRAGTAGTEGGRAHRAGLGPVPCPKACGVPAE